MTKQECQAILDLVIECRITAREVVYSEMGTGKNLKELEEKDINALLAVKHALWIQAE